MPVGPAGFTDRDVDLALPTPSGPGNRPDVGRLAPILKLVRAALDATVGSLTFGAITGSIAANAPLVTEFAKYALAGHSHNRTGLSGFGTAAALNAPASGQAASNEVTLGGDPRLSDARTPLSHTHAQAEVTGLPADLTTAKADWINLEIAGLVNGQVVNLEEYAPVAMTIASAVHRLPTGTLTFKITNGGVDVTGLTGLSPTSSRVVTSATAGSSATVAATNRTTLVVTAAGSPGTFYLTLVRART